MADPRLQRTSNEHLRLLGFQVRDVVTGFTGVIESVSFDLYGCVQAIVKPRVNDKGEYVEGRWFDMKRLVASSDQPVMSVPTFVAVPGGCDKPTQRDGRA